MPNVPVPDISQTNVSNKSKGLTGNLNISLFTIIEVGEKNLEGKSPDERILAKRGKKWIRILNSHNREDFHPLLYGK
jgi:hypothetical protein